jgi:hypothetical protein
MVPLLASSRLHMVMIPKLVSLVLEVVVVPCQLLVAWLGNLSSMFQDE